MPIARYFHYAYNRNPSEVDFPIDLSIKEWDYPLSFIIVYDKKKFLEVMNKETSSYLDFQYALHGEATPVILGRNDDGIWEKAYDIQDRYELCAQDYANDIAFLEEVIEEGE